MAAYLPVTKKESSTHYEEWATEFHYIKMKKGTLANFLAKLNMLRTNNKIKSKEHMNLKKIVWLQKKMKPLGEQNISGEDYELSRRSFLKKLFGESL